MGIITPGQTAIKQAILPGSNAFPIGTVGGDAQGNPVVFMVGGLSKLELTAALLGGNLVGGHMAEEDIDRLVRFSQQLIAACERAEGKRT